MLGQGDRLLDTIMLLDERGPMAPAELRERLREMGHQVSDRTFRRDEVKLLLRRSIGFASLNGDEVCTRKT
jgi:hypothetical protein